jgi:hypothetical protein
MGKIQEIARKIAEHEAAIESIQEELTTTIDGVRYVASFHSSGDRMSLPEFELAFTRAEMQRLVDWIALMYNIVGEAKK